MEDTNFRAVRIVILHVELETYIVVLNQPKTYAEMSHDIKVYIECSPIGNELICGLRIRARVLQRN